MVNKLEKTPTVKQERRFTEGEIALMGAMLADMYRVHQLQAKIERIKQEYPELREIVLDARIGGLKFIK